MSTDGKIQSTTKYDQFIFMPDNRDIVKSHVKLLVKSLEQCNDLHLNAVIVTPKMEIIEGQHRVLAAKELGIPVYYTIDNNYSPEKIITLNTTQKKWQIEDYLKFWCHHDRADYISLKQFQEDLGYSLTLTLKWLSMDDSYMLPSFKNGNFKFKVEEDKLQSIYEGRKIIEYMRSTNYKPIKVFTHTSFHMALKKLLNNPLLNSVQLLEKMETCPYKIRSSTGWQDYFDQFVDIYNHNMGRRKRLRVISEGSQRKIVE